MAVLTGGHEERAGGAIYIENINQVRVIRKAPPPDWSIPASDLNHLLTYRSKVHEKDMVRLRGVLTRNSGEKGVLQNGSRAVKLEFAKPVELKIGEVYEALGVIEKAGSKHLVLRGVRVRPSDSAASIEVRTLDEDSFGSRNFGESLVRIKGRVVASVEVSRNFVGTFQLGDVTHVTSIIPVAEAGGQNPFKIGSITESTGVAELTGDDWSGVEEARIVNRSASDIKVIVPRPWAGDVPFWIGSGGRTVSHRRRPALDPNSTRHRTAPDRSVGAAFARPRTSEAGGRTGD